ncbi:ZPR1 zinc finger domain-containing protein [Candidatus Woesearchaeota archaeon]|nr:ZPR1 zinc finger domain-containing protein [Candidatus Woesearchaeota archaeon]
MGQLEKQPCPMCKGNTLTLTEDEREVPYFGKIYVFSMTCSNCKYHKADVEAAEKQEPSKYSIEVSGEKDMKIRIVKSSEATVKIPHIVTIQPGPASSGYITNVEGILNRVKHQIDQAKENEEDNDAKKKAKKMLKKLNRVMWGQEKLKMIIEDPSGNSAIISEKAVKGKL